MIHSRHRFAAATLALSTATLPVASHAQVAGTVVAGGAPLSRVVVSLWSGHREVARDTTDAAGRFGFDAPRSAEASGLALRRLGFVARTLAVRPGDDALRLTMTPVAQPLPATVVAARSGRSCVRKDDPAARALWDRVRGTYATAPRGMGQGATVSAWVQGDVSAADVGEFDETPRYGDRPGDRAGWFTTPDGTRPQWEAVSRGAYAVRQRLPRPGEELAYKQYLHWWYQPLHRELVEHFVERAFADAHAFTFSPASAQAGPSKALAFCTRDTKRPGLDGVIELDSAHAIGRIAWRWVTPKPHEDAGAELLLIPPTRSVARRLVPARSVYWRRVGHRGDRYYQDGAITTRWYYGERQRVTEDDRVQP